MARSDKKTSKRAEPLSGELASASNKINMALTFYFCEDLYISIFLTMLSFLMVLVSLYYPIVLAATLFVFCYASVHQREVLLERVQTVCTRGSFLHWNDMWLQIFSPSTKLSFYRQIGICEWWHKHTVPFPWKRKLRIREFFICGPEHFGKKSYAHYRKMRSLKLFNCMAAKVATNL